jgi:hypothetical protein
MFDTAPEVIGRSSGEFREKRRKKKFLDLW